MELERLGDSNVYKIYEHVGTWMHQPEKKCTLSNQTITLLFNQSELGATAF